MTCMYLTMKTNRISVLGNSSVGGFYLAPAIVLLRGPVQLILKPKGTKTIMKLGTPYVIKLLESYFTEENATGL